MQYLLFTGDYHDEQEVKTIADAEARITLGLIRLKAMAESNPDAAFAMSFLAPSKMRPVVQLEEDGRKKRNTASVSNWNHANGEVFIYFEPDDEQVSESEPLSTPVPVPQVAPRNASASNGTVPGTQASELKECCLALSEAEKAGKPFIALKWFRDIHLASQPFTWAAVPQDRMRVLNHAIADGLIDTQALTNPRNPTHPTTTVRLNREKAKHLVGSRFNPIPLRGEPLSTIIMRDRG